MVDNGVAGFELEASDANAISGKLAAVGFDAVDEPTGFVLDDEGIDLAKSRGQRVVLEMLTRNIEKTAGATPAFAPNDAPKDGDDGGDDDGTARSSRGARRTRPTKRRAVSRSSATATAAETSSLSRPTIRTAMASRTWSAIRTGTCATNRRPVMHV